MQFSIKYLIICLFISLIIALVGFWLGEIPSGFGSNIIALIIGLPVIIAIILLLNMFIKQHLFINILAGFGLFAVLIIALSMGASSYQAAFNDCVTNGEKVRLALRDYFKNHQSYPQSLAALNMHLPGKLLMHQLIKPSILQYQVNDNGYLLHFDDNFISFESTESAAFEASK